MRFWLGGEGFGVEGRPGLSFSTSSVVGNRVKPVILGLVPRIFRGNGIDLIS